MVRGSWVVDRVARLLLLASWFAAILPFPALAQGEPLGIVIMHGKGGSPARLVADLAHTLESQGFLVANIEMPWSGNRNYDVPVSRAEAEVETALAGLRSRGAKRAFIAGHSQGGAFALHLAGRLRADGVIAIAPGGDVASRVFREKLGDSVALARQRVAEGKGNEPERLEDYEGSRGTSSMMVAPAVYLTWFDPEGAMNMERAVRAASSEVPVLFIIPTRDYPGLLQSNPRLFHLLPRNSLTRLYEPEADHRGAPTASADEIARWAREVAAARN